jgi:hypothetical protein
MLDAAGQRHVLADRAMNCGVAAGPLIDASAKQHELSGGGHLVATTRLGFMQVLKEF